MKRKIFALLLVGASFAASATPTYEQALSFRNSMYTAMSHSILKLDKPLEVRAFSIEVNKFPATAARLFGPKNKAGSFEVCLSAAAGAVEYWQTQLSAAGTPTSFGVGSSARSGFEFGQSYGRCADQIETLYKPGAAGRGKIIDISK